MHRTTSYRLGLGLALATTALLVLAAGAVGIVGDGGRADRAYLVVPAVLALGGAAARLRPRGLALALGATALTHVVVTAAVLLAGAHGVASVADLVGTTAGFAGMYAAAGWLVGRTTVPASGDAMPLGRG